MHIFLSMVQLELRRTLRDANTLLYIGFPVFAYPFIVWASIQGFVYFTDQGDTSLAVEAPADLHDVLEEAGLEIRTGGLEAVDAGGLHASIERANGELRVHHRAGSVPSRLAVERIEDALEDDLEGRRVAAADRLDVVLYEVEDEPTDEPSRMMYWFVGLLVGMLAPLTTLISTTYPTMELFVVEREKGLLETLFTSSIDRRMLIVARLLVASALAWFAALVNALALTVTLAHGVALLTDLEADLLAAIPATVVAVPILLATCALVMTTLTAILYSGARTFREAQMLFSFGSMLLVGPTLVSLFACMEDWGDQLLPYPLFHSGPLLFDAIRGQLSASSFAIGLATDIGFVFLLLFVWDRVLGLDRLIQGVPRPAWLDRLLGDPA